MRNADCGLRTDSVITPRTSRRGKFSNPQSTIRNPQSHLRGFTLIEVILAVALSVGLFGAMMWLYQQAAEVRAEVTTEIQRINARRLILDRITEQLRSSSAYPAAGIGMEGSTDKITFVTTVLPPPNVYNAPDLTQQAFPPQQDVHIVTYNLRISEGEQGSQTIAGLEAGVQKLLTATVIVESEESPVGGAADQNEREEAGIALPNLRKALLSPLIQFIRFQYFDGTQWTEDWMNTELPRAVEIAIGYEPLPVGVDPAEYPYDLHRRVVHVHAARRQQAGSTVRGIGDGPGL